MLFCSGRRYFKEKSFLLLALECSSLFEFLPFSQNGESVSKLSLNFSASDVGIVVSIAAFQAVDPGSIPGHRRRFFIIYRKHGKRCSFCIINIQMIEKEFLLKNNLFSLNIRCTLFYPKEDSCSSLKRGAVISTTSDIKRRDRHVCKILPLLRNWAPREYFAWRTRFFFPDPQTLPFLPPLLPFGMRVGAILNPGQAWRPPRPE